MAGISDNFKAKAIANLKAGGWAAVGAALPYLLAIASDAKDEGGALAAAGAIIGLLQIGRAHV